MKPRAFLDHPVFVWASSALLAATVGCFLWARALSNRADVIALGAIAAVIAVILFTRSKVPGMFGFLLAIAAAVNGAGYALKLWHEDTLFDELVHGFTAFAGMAMIGWAMLGSERFAGSRTRLFFTVIGIGLIVGILWEVFEWMIGIIGSAKDTAIDLAMDGAGTLAAAIFILSLAASGQHANGSRKR